MHLQKILKNPLFVASSTISAIFLAALLQWSRGFVEFSDLMIGLGMVLFIIVMNIIFVGLFHQSAVKDELESRIQDLRILLSDSKMDWLLNEKMLSAVNRDAKEVWVFTPNIGKATDIDSPIFQSMKDSLEKGTKYIYYMPDRPRIHKFVADFKKLHNFEEGQVKFILIPAKNFIFHTHIAVFEPHSPKPQAIEWLPIRNIDFYIEMDEEHSNRMVGIGIMLEEKIFKDMQKEI